MRLKMFKYEQRIQKSYQKDLALSNDRVAPVQPQITPTQRGPTMKKKFPLAIR